MIYDPLTPAQIALARAPLHDQEWRVSVLPPVPASLGALFSVGEPIQNLPQPVALAGGISDGEGVGANNAITIAIAGDISLYPANGTIAISDQFGSVSWWSYTSKGAASFGGASRLPHGHQGAHAIGDPVDIRRIISGQIRRVVVEEFEEYGRLGQPVIYDWRGRVEGEGFDQNIYLPESTFLLEARFWEPLYHAAYGGWSPWYLMARGYATDGYGISYDGESGRRQWDGSISSGRVFVRRDRISSRSYRVQELSPTSVTASSTLGSPMDVEPDEYLEHSGSAEPSNLADGRVESRWISQNAPTHPSQAVSIPPAPNWQQGLLKINAVCVNPPTGTPLQWIEFVASRNPTYTKQYGLTITTRIAGYNTEWNYEPLQYGWPPGPVTWFLQLPDLVLGAPPDYKPTLILASSAQLFIQRHGNPPNAHVIDWTTIPGFLVGGYPGAGVRLPLEQAGLALRWLGAHLPSSIEDFVAYGDWQSDPANLFMPNDHAHPNSPTSHWGTGHNTVDIDPGLTLGNPGSTIRREPTLNDSGNRASNWTVDNSPVPGDPGILVDDAWVVASVPQFLSATTQAMDAGSPAPGETLGITDATALSATGHLKIGAEIVRYEANPDDLFQSVVVAQRDVTNEGNTTHASGTSVLQYVPDRNEATAYESIARLEITRPATPVDDNGNPIRMEIAEIWAGDEGATFTGPNWHLSWYGDAPLHVLQVPANSNPNVWVTLRGWPHDTEDNRRYARIGWRILRMTDDGRAKGNELRLWRSRAIEVQNGEYGLGAIVRELLERIFPPHMIAINYGFHLLGEGIPVTLVEGPTEAATKSWCEQALVVMRFTREGGVQFEYAPHHPGFVPVVDPNWMDERMIRDQQRTRRRPRLGGGQVTVRIENRATGEVVAGSYPPAPTDGSPVELVIQVQAGIPLDPTTLARALYLGNASRAVELAGTLTGFAPTIRVGQWWIVPDATSGDEIVWRSMRIAGITHSSDGATEIVMVEWRSYGE
ncbi:MAG: hypothetical protein H6637_05155 [Ardenticatenales bacterium]|nr:hypothetical protein [Ardenticatenales bacterium]